jgi:hypothetical protein
MGKFFVGAGPYLSFNVSGSDKYTYTEPTGTTNSGNMALSTDYELGLNAVGGIELKNGFLVKLNYAYGNNKLYTYNDQDINSTNISLSVAYIFKKADKKKAKKE